MSDQRIIQLGIPRSGSTFVWQVLAHLLGADRVIKAHPADAESWHLRHLLRKVVTVRHPCDVVGSLWAIREPDHQQLPEHLVHVITYTQQQFFALRHWLTQDDFVLRYEDHVLSPGHRWVFDVLPGTSKADHAAAIQYASIESNRARAAAMSTFEEHDPITHIHGKHIGALHPGSWRGIIPAAWHETIIMSMQPFLTEWNYAE